MKIVIDTNIIHKDFFLQNAQIISLCETAKKCGIKVLIPQIVIDEVINHYREKINDTKKEIQKAKDNLQFFYPDEPFPDYFSSQNIGILLTAYKHSLNRRLNELNILPIPYPNISHVELVKRDLDRKKPFQPSGKGYRDALIWESVLNIIENKGTNPDVVFINKNTNDFFEKGKLHPDLQEDVANKGLAPKSIEIFEDITKAIDTHIKPRQASLDGLLQSYAGKDNIGKIDINAYIIDIILPDILNEYKDNIPYFQSGAGRYFENVNFIKIDDYMCQVTDIRLLNDDQIIVDVDSAVIASYFAYLHRADSFLLDDKEMPVIVDPHIDRHYMEVENSIKLSIKVSLIIDKNLENVASHSVTVQ